MKIAFVLIFLTLARFDSALAKAPRPTPLLLMKGKSVFATHCASCHAPKDFESGVFKHGGSPEQIFTSVSKGIKDTEMPAFEKLSEEERWAVAYYLRTFKKTAK